MARKKNLHREPISSAVRVRMYRARQKIKKQQAAQLYETPNVSNSSKEFESPDSSSLKNELRHWFNSFDISTRALDSLLSILNNFGINCVPKNHRTLLETPLNIEIRELAGGKYWHNGLRKCLQQIFPELNRDVTISLNFNVDGLPLFKSSKISFWPILSSIHGM